MASSILLRISILFSLIFWNAINQCVIASERTERAAIAPCLTCTVLNRVPCCTRYQKCCSNSSIVLPIPPPQARVSPPAAPTRRPRCPLGMDLSKINPTCGSICSNDAQCAQDTKCCPPIPQCCRQLESNQCPTTNVSADLCQNCLSDSSCPRSQSCCPQTGRTGCCVNAQGIPTPLRSSPNADTSDQSSSKVDSETVRVDASLPATELPNSTKSQKQPNPPATSATPQPSSAITPSQSQESSDVDSGEIEKVVYQDENGEVTTMTYTLYTNKDGVVISVTTHEGGESETITRTASEEEEDDGESNDGTEEEDGGESSDATEDEKGDEAEEGDTEKEQQEEGLAKEFVSTTIENIVGHINIENKDDSYLVDAGNRQRRNIENGNSDFIAPLEPSFSAPSTSYGVILTRVRTTLKRQ